MIVLGVLGKTIGKSLAEYVGEFRELFGDAVVGSFGFHL
jgi:hypothetical protein